MGGQIITIISILSKIGKFWSTYFDVFEKPSKRATSHKNFFGPKLRNKNVIT